jgi:hypothetical protein
MADRGLWRLRRGKNGSARRTGNGRLGRLEWYGTHRSGRGINRWRLSYIKKNYRRHD